MANSKLEYYAKEYIKDVNKVCLMMLQGYNLGTKEDLVKHREVHPQGEFHLNGSNKYTFHGRGCRFSNGNIEIDWDFGYGDVWCGLDPWKLACYIRDIKDNREWTDGNKVKEVFEELVSKGEMEKLYDLYYFT